MWEGIVNLDKKKVAIVWNNADNMLSHGLLDLLNISQTFLDVVRELYDIRLGHNKQITLKIYLIGSGDNFVDFE